MSSSKKKEYLGADATGETAMEGLASAQWPRFLLFFLFYFTATSPDSRQHSVAKTDQTTRRGGKKVTDLKKGTEKGSQAAAS